jgi:hypothetical protein
MLIYNSRDKEHKKFEKYINIALYALCASIYVSKGKMTYP